ncbi:MAG: hypothetical protein KAS32_04345 [Candidatus Peribacteraceae bacterium]|nr:hypothetical protein [Candidatus Peribacteraceae bacterium]
MVLISNSYSADSNARQAWDIVHVTGSALGCAYMNHLGLEWYQSAIVMFVFGIMWELADEFAHTANWQQSYFDYYRGGEWDDIKRNTFGICLSFPIRRR